MPGNGENARTSRIRPVRQRYRLANRMPKQGSNSRVSVSVHICWCECVWVWACVRLPFSMWVMRILAYSYCPRSHFVAFRCISCSLDVYPHTEQNSRASRSLEIATAVLTAFSRAAFWGFFFRFQFYFDTRSDSPGYSSALASTSCRERVERQLPTAPSSADAKRTTRIHSNTL